MNAIEWLIYLKKKKRITTIIIMINSTFASSIYCNVNQTRNDWMRMFRILNESKAQKINSPFLFRFFFFFGNNKIYWMLFCVVAVDNDDDDVQPTVNTVAKGKKRLEMISTGIEIVFYGFW